MTSTAPPGAATIGVLLGSVRPGGNNAGLAAWLLAAAYRTLSTVTSTSSTTTNTADTTVTTTTTVDAPYCVQQIFPLPASDANTARWLGPVLDPRIAASVKSSAEYQAPAVQRWSSTVQSCAAFVVVTPQYNHGIPGELKNALDHLYHEWRGKPVLVATFGGHGGGRCDEQLRVVLGSGLKMRVVGERVQIVLPHAYIMGDRRIGDGGDDTFLEQYEAPLTTAISRLAAMLQPAAETTKVPAGA